MMRTLLYSLSLATLIGISNVSTAQMKIGYVNANRLLEQAPQAQAAWSKLETEFASRDEELKSMRDAIRDMESELNDLGVTEVDRRNELEREIRQAQRELARVEADFRDDFNNRRNQELQSLQSLIQQVIKSIQQDRDYSLILNQDAVAAASESVDITPQVLERLSEIEE